MLHLTLKSEYSFGECYGFLKELHKKHTKGGYIGVADSNTFSFYKLQQLCKKNDDTPVYGYRCTVVQDATEKVKYRGQFGAPYIIIAKNAKGIKEIFNLTSIMSKNFHYRGNVSVSDIESLSDNVFVISTDPIAHRLDYIGMGFSTPDKVRKYNHPKVFVDENFYDSGEDKKVYQLYAGRKSNDKSCPQKVLNKNEAIYYFGKECVDELDVLAKQIEKFDLPHADNIKYKKDDNIRDLAILGANELNVDLEDPIYKERFDREITLIEEKEYSDYLLVVAEIISEAKKYALMGPGRGSSGGSLVCYLLGITTFDPIPYGLVFERFIDVNRYDPPDVDFDVPDKHRAKVVKWIESRYGIDNVKTISNITKFKPKSAIGEFAKIMQIPRFETEAVKDSIINRKAGDARAALALKDTFENTDVGVEFLKKFPEMSNAAFIENHAKNKGKHAAGVIVCNDILTDYCGVDERDQTVYLDKKDAEALNLLKVDVLGLRTLSVLQDCARSIGMDYNDFYKLPLDDKKTYKVFEEKRLGGVFQFEGEAMRSINDSASMGSFEDIVAAGALGRPGALSSGGTSRYVQLKNGLREPIYHCEKHKRITEETFGIVVYQEQMMFLCREIAGMSWQDVTDVRIAASKSLGDEYFEKHRVKFVEGAVKLSGYDEETALKTWLDISSMGSYAFNKAHSVAYGVVSYWCAYMKAHYPLQFIAAILNNSKDDESSLRILREFYETENLTYKAVDAQSSGVEWELRDGILMGGLTNIKGVGVKKANEIIQVRKGNKKLTPGILKMMENPKTPFDILYPTLFHFGDMYKNPMNYGLNKVSEIVELDSAGEYAIIGKMIGVDDVDANDVQAVAKRNGEYLEGPHMKVHFRVEDDSGVMMCIVGRFVYEQLAHEFLKEKIGKTWYCLIGKVMEGTKILHIEKVANLTNQVGLKETEEIRDEQYRELIQARRSATK